MYGVEAAVLGFACLVALVTLWSAPFWIRAVRSIGAYFSRQVDKVDSTEEKDIVYPKEER